MRWMLSKNIAWVSATSIAGGFRSDLRKFFAFRPFFRNAKPRMSTSTSSIVSPVHALHVHEASSSLILASASSLYKYNPGILAIESSFTSPESSYAAFIASSEDWIFISGGDKFLRVLNARTLELVAELFPQVIRKLII